MKLPDGYARDELLSLDFVGRAQDLVFYGKTGRGKTHLATALGMSAIDRGMNVRFLPTAELVLQLGRAKREGTLETMLKDIAKADLIIPARVRLRALRRRRRQTALPGHRRQLREKEHHLHHEHRVQQMGHDLRRRQTRRLDHRPHRSPRTTHRVHRTKPPHQPGTHVRQTPKPIKHTRPAHPRPKPKKIPDENRNTNLTKNTCRWEIRKADKQGVVEIDSHRYLAGPSWHGWTLDVGLRAFDVEIRTQDGRSVARLPRVYGKDPGTVRNPASLLPALARKTRAWGESPIRGDFPDKLRLAIDAQDSKQRQRTFRLIAKASDASGFEASAAAAEHLVEQGHGIDEASLMALSRRIAAGETPHDEPAPDLRDYDRFMRPAEDRKEA